MSNKPTQEERVLEELSRADGAWVNGQHFLHGLMLSQYHRAIWNLQKRRDRYAYGGAIEASTFTDAYGFKSYRLVAPNLAMGAAAAINAIDPYKREAPRAEIAVEEGNLFATKL